MRDVLVEQSFWYPHLTDFTAVSRVHLHVYTTHTHVSAHDFVYTVYPEILAIIKFGDLHKIRLYFNIGRN